MATITALTVVEIILDEVDQKHNKYIYRKYNKMILDISYNEEKINIVLRNNPVPEIYNIGWKARIIIEETTEHLWKINRTRR
jgi:hypothetical protein